MSPDTRSTRPRVVIVGGGFGGLSAATALADAPVDVTLVDRLNHHLFQPMLYQLATGIVSDGDIAPPLRGVLAGQDNLTVRLAEVDRIDLTARRVSACAPDDDRVELDYDHLIVAAGSHPAYFGNDQWAEHAPGLKTLRDAHHIRDRILGAFELAADAGDEAERRRWLTFVTVGGGPTGVELTGQIAELSHHLLHNEFTAIDTASAEIHLIDAGDALLTMFPPRLRRRAQHTLEGMGVTVSLGEMVTDIDQRGVTMKSKAGEERRIEAGTVIWGAGVHASELGETLLDGSGKSVDKGGRVTVDEHCALPDHPEVFVIGDMAAIKDVPGVAQPAIQEGRHAAEVIRARVNGEALPGPFKYFDKGSLATIGHGNAVADAFGVQLSGFIAQIVWGVVHLAYLTGWGNRLGTVARWGWALTFRKRGELSIATGELRADLNH